MNLKQNLKYLRNINKLSYRALGKHTGIYFGKLERLENDKTKLTILDDLQTLAFFYNVSIKDLLYEDLTKNKKNLLVNKKILK